MEISKLCVFLQKNKTIHRSVDFINIYKTLNMNDKLDKIFEIVSFYDDCRWARKENYNLINFYKDGLDDDTKLLTHWLCYIADRQMGYERIWDIGGFVFSELADNFKKVATPEGLFPLLNPNLEISFIRKDEIDPKRKKEPYSFTGKISPNKLIADNYPDDIENDRVVFKSRYLPSDYYNIRYTLDLLYEYEKSLSCFIAKAYHTHKKDKDRLIQRILFSLYLLTYYYEENGQPSYENIKKQNINIKNRTKNVKAILNSSDLFQDKFNDFVKVKIFQQKRAWCSLRDFLKSPEFKGYFKNAMINSKYLTEYEIDELLSDNMLHQLELPGDVWNNNSKFRKCVFKDTDYANKTENFNILLRKYHDANPGMQAYPEQFDITFDFVPRMCDNNNCEICPIGYLANNKNKGKDFEKTCINNKNKYCPVALVGCGYKINCYEKKDCILCKVLEF